MSIPLTFFAVKINQSNIILSKYILITILKALFIKLKFLFSHLLFCQISSLPDTSLTRTSLIHIKGQFRDSY